MPEPEPHELLRPLKEACLQLRHSILKAEETLRDPRTNADRYLLHASEMLGHAHDDLAMAHTRARRTLRPPDVEAIVPLGDPVLEEPDGIAVRDEDGRRIARFHLGEKGQLFAHMTVSAVESHQPDCVYARHLLYERRGDGHYPRGYRSPSAMRSDYV